MRHVRRLVAAYRQEGVGALAHGNQGRSPAQKVPEAIRRQVVWLAQKRYPGCNESHLTEVLAEREGIALSRSTVRRIVREAGMVSPRHRRPPAHRVRRERYPQEGMLLQVDGSHHAWLEDRGPRLVLLGAIDDAIGSVFWRSPSEADTLEEQLAGRREPTQVGRVLEELEIGLVYARSPQAKGRIEHLWGTFQDRLVAELRWAGASTLAEANTVLAAFPPGFNARFGVEAPQPESAYRPWSEALDSAQVFCLKERRMVAKDNTVQWHGQRWQLFPTPQRTSYAKARVEVQDRLDGSVAFVHQGVVLPAAPASARTSAPPLSPPTTPPSPATPVRTKSPSPNHPWRRRVTSSLDS